MFAVALRPYGLVLTAGVSRTAPGAGFRSAAYVDGAALHTSLRRRPGRRRTYRSVSSVMISVMCRARARLMRSAGYFGAL